MFNLSIDLKFSHQNKKNTIYYFHTKQFLTITNLSVHTFCCSSKYTINPTIIKFLKLIVFYNVFVHIKQPNQNSPKKKNPLRPLSKEGPIPKTVNSLEQNEFSLIE